MEEWQEHLTEEQRAHPALAKFQGKSVSDLFKSYTELDAWRGGAVKLPTEDSPKEEWDKLGETFQKRGLNVVPVPDWDDEAQVSAFAKAIGAPEEYDAGDLDEEAAKRFGALSKKLGLSAKQHEDLVAAMVEVAKDGEDAAAAADESNTQALKTAWGASFNERMARINSAAEKTIGQTVKLDANQAMLVDKLLDGLKGSPQGEELASTGNVGPTPDEIAEKMTKLRRKMQAHDYQPSTEERKRDQRRFLELVEQQEAANRV